MRLQIRICVSVLKRDECPVCKEVFTTKSSLKIHMQNAHFATGLHECPTCKRMFSSRATLKRHALIHSGKAPLISKNFGIFSFIRILGVRPFACSICPATFTQKSVLTTHMKTHKDPAEQISDLLCSFCGQNDFKSRSQFSSHTSTCKNKHQKSLKTPEPGESTAKKRKSSEDLPNPNPTPVIPEVIPGTPTTDKPLALSSSMPSVAKSFPSKMSEDKAKPLATQTVTAVGNLTLPSGPKLPSVPLDSHSLPNPNPLPLPTPIESPPSSSTSVVSSLRNIRPNRHHEIPLGPPPPYVDRRPSSNPQTPVEGQIVEK